MYFIIIEVRYMSRARPNWQCFYHMTSRSGSEITLCNNIDEPQVVLQLYTSVA